jgi:hypothetical protein
MPRFAAAMRRWFDVTRKSSSMPMAAKSATIASVTSGDAAPSGTSSTSKMRLAMRFRTFTGSLSRHLGPAPPQPRDSPQEM